MTTKLFTSESVTEGHPDKLCDQISDAVLDAALVEDPQSRVAVETLATNGMIQIAGEMTTESYVNIQEVARKTVLDVGYDDSAKSFDGNTCGINVAISPQSPDIALGVDEACDYDGDELDLLGAGDQGIMFGYATNENPLMMPTPILIAHRLVRKLAEVRKNENGMSDILYPDGKSQVTVQYKDGEFVGIDTVLLSTQHAEGVSNKELREILQDAVIVPVLADFRNELSLFNGEVLTGPNTVLVNPTGRFVLGGPKGDAGLTGRKIIVDTYGGMARHGGGAFSGKDATKVDRSAAYALRWVAKHIIAAGLAHKVEVQAAYAIGVAKPVAVYVDSFGTGDDEVISQAVEQLFDLRPAAIIRELNLTTAPRYVDTATGGHFGRSEAGFTWEQIDEDKIVALRQFSK